MQHKLTLVRKSNDDVIFKIAAVDKCEVELRKVDWDMPRVHQILMSKRLVCTKAMDQRLSWTPHFECVSVVLLRFLRKRGPLTGGWAYAPHR